MRADKSLKPFEIRLYRHYRVVHGVRIALAFVLTFLLVRLLNVPEGTWPLITLVVVMGPISFWGNVVPRAFQRIGGSGDVIFGSLLAMLFTGIWPQRAFIHWRIQMASYVTNFNRLYQAGFSPNLVDRPRLEKHLQQALNDVVKMRGLITPASKETHIQKAIFEAIQTVSRNLVCMLELQINAWWATRPGHFVMLNAHTLRETQQMTQQTLLSIAHALYEGNPQPVRANNEKLTEIVLELRQLLKEQGDDGLAETPVHGYVWLSIELARQLELLSHLICRALRK